MSETKAFKELEDLLSYLREAQLDAEWCWNALGDPDYYFWKVGAEDEVVAEFEEILLDMERSQQDYERAAKRLPKAMQRVLEVMQDA